MKLIMENWNKFLDEQSAMDPKGGQQAFPVGSAMADTGPVGTPGQEIDTKILKDFLDLGVMTLSGVLKLVPGIGTGTATAANLASAGIYLMGEEKNYLGAALAFGSALAPGIGDAAAITTKAFRMALPVPKPVLIALRDAVGTMIDYYAQGIMTKKLQTIMGQGGKSAKEFWAWWHNNTGVPLAAAIREMEKELIAFKQDIEKSLKAGA